MTGRVTRTVPVESRDTPAGAVELVFVLYREGRQEWRVEERVASAVHSTTYGLDYDAARAAFAGTPQPEGGKCCT